MPAPRSQPGVSNGVFKWGRKFVMVVSFVVGMWFSATSLARCAVQIEGVKKYKGYYGVNHGSVAIQVTKKVSKE